MPLAIDLFCGLGGWADGLMAEGYDVTGYDIEAHEYGDMRYPAKLVLRDVLTIHGSEFKDADLIVASPPCQEYSYMAMPWSRAKAKAADIRADMTGQKLEALNRLFNACFRIQAEACEAAGRHIPMVVENVRGAQPWVGPARWNFGSFYLWGDVPALMPKALKAQKFNPDGTQHPPGSWFAVADSKNRGARSEGAKVPGFRFDGTGRSFQSAAVEGTKVPSEDGRRTDIGNGARFTSRDCGIEGVKGAGGGWFNDLKRQGKGETGSLSRSGSKSPARKAASAMIAKIPLALSRHIAATYLPQKAS